MDKNSWVANTVKKMERIYQAECKNCGRQVIYTVTTADTDMVPLYCGSVYAPKDRILVIAELTGDEYNLGCEGRLPERMEQIFGDRFVYLNYKSKCPFCGGSLGVQSQIPWEAYLAERGRAFVVFYDEHYAQKVKEIL